MGAKEDVVLDLEPKQPSEQFPVGFNFVNYLASGEEISSVVVSAAKESDGSDATATIIEGSAQVGDVASDNKTFTANPSGTWVAITIKGGTDGIRYKITLKITTSVGSKFEVDVILPVKEY
jgi:hypothetical protein